MGEFVPETSPEGSGEGRVRQSPEEKFGHREDWKIPFLVGIKEGARENLSWGERDSSIVLHRLRKGKERLFISSGTLKIVSCPGTTVAPTGVLSGLRSFLGSY